MKPGIAPAFAVAMQVRAAGGTCAAAAAAAGAASITAASGTDFENIDAMVTDAVRATGGTKGVAMVASHTAVFHANSRNARSGVIDLHRADVRGTLSLYLRQNVDATDSCAQTSSLQGAGSTDSLINLKLHKHAPKPSGRLLAEIAPGNSDPCFIKALTQFVDSKRITCIVPPNLPLHSVHLAFSKSGNALLMNAVSFSATVEVSFSGPDGPFSIDNALYEYVRPVTLKAILPAGDHLVPGHSILSLKGHSIISSKALTLHMTGDLRAISCQGIVRPLN